MAEARSFERVLSTFKIVLKYAVVNAERNQWQGQTFCTFQMAKAHNSRSILERVLSTNSVVFVMNLIVFIP
ncbi:hypothetical protein SLEP1_g58627 [Rubroshorea leprosula]|uniref:Uncharacterized protein n=1 Tax=Rubroshorea leprosula TaxID=152421 RepID=A0AAV5MSC6_9ROSI|nr:hypothetical protein SLEP1_g58627 [Rubroshorea leprosula]